MALEPCEPAGHVTVLPPSAADRDGEFDGRRPHVGRQVRVCVVDAGVHHADDVRGRSGRHVPRGDRVDVGARMRSCCSAPTSAEIRIVGHRGRVQRCSSARPRARRPATTSPSTAPARRGCANACDAIRAVPTGRSSSASISLSDLRARGRCVRPKPDQHFSGGHRSACDVLMKARVCARLRSHETRPQDQSGGEKRQAQTNGADVSQAAPDSWHYGWLKSCRTRCIVDGGTETILAWFDRRPARSACDHHLDSQLPFYENAHAHRHLQRGRQYLSALHAILIHLPASSVLVVDDNSPDGTANAVQALADHDNRVSVICRTTERGYGSAMIAGLRHGIEHGFDSILTLDADFSHDPADLAADAGRTGRTPTSRSVRATPAAFAC